MTNPPTPIPEGETVEPTAASLIADLNKLVGVEGTSRAWVAPAAPVIPPHYAKRIAEIESWPDTGPGAVLPDFDSPVAPLPAQPEVGTPREDLMGQTLGDYTRRNLRVACSAWSAARDVQGNISEAMCQIGAAFQKRAKCGIEEMERELAQSQAKVAELERNEREYERIIGPKSYQEVADERAEMVKDAELYRWLREQASLNRAMQSVSVVLRVPDCDFEHISYQDAFDLGVAWNAWRTGTFKCPICGRDTPHSHTQKEIDAARAALAGEDGR